MRLSRRASRSEGLEVFEQGPLLLGWEIGPVGRALVAAVPVSGLAGVEPEQGPPFLGGQGSNEADVDRIVDVPAAIEDLGPRPRRLEQFAQVGNRTVVQVGGTQPDPVQRRIGVAEGLSEVAEPLGISRRKSPVLLVTGVEGVLADREEPGVGVEPAAVGADPGDRNHGAHALVRPRRVLTERRLPRAMTAGAVTSVEVRSLRGPRLVDGVRIWRWPTGLEG